MEKETNRDPKRFASGTLVIKEPITTMFPVNQVGPEKRNPSPPRHLDTPIPQIDTRTTVQKAIVVNKEPQLEEQRREEDPLLLSEVEMNLLAEQYGSVDLEMDEEMIDEDDLLDDMMEEVAMVPETQEPPETDATITHVKPASKNQEAQEQLNRAMAGEDLIGEKIQTSSKEARNEKERKQEKQGSKGQKDKPTGVDGKRRNMRSPDTKGLTASKKLAIRGRASPKGKLSKHARLDSGRVLTSTTVPRTEVYPSAVRSRKTFVALGSVGSQKPPSTHI